MPRVFTNSPVYQRTGAGTGAFSLLPYATISPTNTQRVPGFCRHCLTKNCRRKSQGPDRTGLKWPGECLIDFNRGQRRTNPCLGYFKSTTSKFTWHKNTYRFIYQTSITKKITICKSTSWYFWFFYCPSLYHWRYKNTIAGSDPPRIL